MQILKSFFSQKNGVIIEVGRADLWLVFTRVLLTVFFFTTFIIEIILSIINTCTKLKCQRIPNPKIHYSCEPIFLHNFFISIFLKTCGITVIAAWKIFCRITSSKETLYMLPNLSNVLFNWQYCFFAYLSTYQQGAYCQEHKNYVPFVFWCFNIAKKVIITKVNE